jgi:CBS domain-containing protein
MVGRHRKAPRTAVTVADVMAIPHIAEPDAPLLEIIYRLLSLGQREIVVVSGQRPVGVITRANLAPLADPAAGSSGRRAASDLLPSRTPWLLPDEDLARAASRMSAEDAEALPVVDYAGSLVGVLARRHIVAHVAGAAGTSDVMDPATAGSSGRLAVAPAAPPPELDEDRYGPASFPASDPPSTWAGRDTVVELT